MANYTATISNFIVGDDLDVTRTIPSGVLSVAWLTIRKSFTSTSGIIAKRITDSSVAGVGHITDTGSDGSGQVKFYLTKDDTVRLNPLSDYVYDIQVLYTNNRIETFESGTITGSPQVTTVVI